MQDLEKNWKKIPKTGESRQENLVTQPLRQYKIFNNAKVLTEAWYPVIPSKKLKKKTAHSFKLGSQRFVLYRGEDKIVRAVDAFCPHMGADLSRGSVEGDSIRCYFHRWKFNAEGELTDIPCKKPLPFAVKTNSYPVEEHYGYIWVYSGTKVQHPFPKPVGLEDSEVDGGFLMSHRLFAHHHVLMASAIDLQHFGSVHGLHANFKLDIQENAPGLFHWNVRGVFDDRKSWRMTLARIFLGDSFQYDALFSAGSLICMTYGRDQRLSGGENSWRLPTFYVMWGCVPLANGLSDVYIFVLQKKNTGAFAWFKRKTRFLLTVLLLAYLKDDDVDAFPNMRFQAQNLIDQDSSVAHLIRVTETLPRSQWSFENSL